MAAAGVARRGVVERAAGQAALADAARADDRNHLALGAREQGLELPEFGLAADESRLRLGCRRARRSDNDRRCFHEVAQRPGGLDTELFGQVRGVAPVGSTCLGVLAALPLGRQQRRDGGLRERIDHQPAPRRVDAGLRLGLRQQMVQRGRLPVLVDACAFGGEPDRQCCVARVVDGLQRITAAPRQRLGEATRTALLVEGLDIGGHRPAQRRAIRLNVGGDLVRLEQYLAQVAPAFGQAVLGPQQRGDAVAFDPAPGLQREHHQQLKAPLGSKDDAAGGVQLGHAPQAQRGFGLQRRRVGDRAPRGASRQDERPLTCSNRGCGNPPRTGHDTLVPP
jgi:hypothetical protein